MDFVVVVVNWHYCGYRYVLHTYSKYFCSIWRVMWRELEGLSVERGFLTHRCVAIWESPCLHLCEADTMMVKGVDSGASLPGFECWLGSFWSVWPEASDGHSVPLFSYLRKRQNNRTGHMVVSIKGIKMCKDTGLRPTAWSMPKKSSTF